MGKLIVFEGCHASGKTALINILRSKLVKRGKSVLLTKEIFDDDIRNSLIRITDQKQDIQRNIAVLYLVAADRFIHVQWMKNLMNNYDLIISDRYLLSSFVYQQMQGFSLNKISSLNNFAFRPALTIYVKTKLNDRLARSIGRDKPDSMFRKDYIREEIIYNSIVRKYKKSHNIFEVDNSKIIIFTVDRILNIIKKNQII